MAPNADILVRLKKIRLFSVELDNTEAQNDSNFSLEANYDSYTSDCR